MTHQDSKRKARLLLFWDYDTQWGGDRSRSPGGAKQWGAAEFGNTERLLELHAEYGLSACFAVVGAASLPGNRPYHDPHQVRRIHAAGHEIASHSHRHEWLPGLDSRALHETLACSKDALEQCIGASVVTFVPPYNQPFDCPELWSFSLSERREAWAGRTDLRRLCQALRDCGYRFCRVSYRTLWERLLDKVYARRIHRPAEPERIAGLICMRLNTPCGFAKPTLELVEEFITVGGWVVVYGHPHSLRSGNSQDEKYLIPFMKQIGELQRAGHLEVVLPRAIVGSF